MKNNLKTFILCINTWYFHEKSVLFLLFDFSNRNLSLKQINIKFNFQKIWGKMWGKENKKEK